MTTFVPEHDKHDKVGSGINFDYDRTQLMGTPEYQSLTPQEQHIFLLGAKMAYWFNRLAPVVGTDAFHQHYREEFDKADVHRQNLIQIATTLQLYLPGEEHNGN